MGATSWHNSDTDEETLCVLLLTDVNSNMEELSAGINSKKKKSKQQPVHTNHMCR